MSHLKFQRNIKHKSITNVYIRSLESRCKVIPRPSYVCCDDDPDLKRLFTKDGFQVETDYCDYNKNLT